MIVVTALQCFPLLQQLRCGWPFLFSHHCHARHRHINFQNRPVHRQPALTNCMQPLPAPISHMQTEGGRLVLLMDYTMTCMYREKGGRGFILQGDSETFVAVWWSVRLTVPKLPQHLLIFCYQNHIRTSLVDDIKLIKLFEKSNRT